MGDGQGYSVQQDSIRQIVTGYDDAVRGLAELIGGGAAEAGAAQGLTELAASAADLGHPDTERLFGDYITRIGWWLRERMHTAEDMADKLRTTLDDYESTQEWAEGLFKELAVRATNPDANLAARAKDMSWGEVAQGMSADWSGWGEALGSISENVPKLNSVINPLGGLAQSMQDEVTSKVSGWGEQ